MPFSPEFPEVAELYRHLDEIIARKKAAAKNRDQPQLEENEADRELGLAVSSKIAKQSRLEPTVKKRGRPQLEAEGDHGSTIPSRGAKRPRLESTARQIWTGQNDWPIINRGYPTSADISSVGQFKEFFCGSLENNLRQSNRAGNDSDPVNRRPDMMVYPGAITVRSFEEFKSSVGDLLEKYLHGREFTPIRVEEVSRIPVTKQKREMAHRAYMKRRLPLEYQFELEEERRRATEQTAAGIATSTALVVSASAPSEAAAAAAAMGTVEQKAERQRSGKPFRRGKSKEELDAEMDMWRKENGLDE